MLVVRWPGGVGPARFLGGQGHPAMIERIRRALAAAGAAGNLLDRLNPPTLELHGAVVEWHHVSFYASNV